MRKQVQLVLFTIASAALVAALMLVFMPSYTAHAGGSWEVVATGLNGPFHLDVADNGTIYVAEQGPPPAEQGDNCIDNPMEPAQTLCLGQTGAVRMIEPGAPPSQ